MEQTTPLNEELNTLEEQSSIFELIFEIINNLFSNLFSSIDNGIYTLLDNIVFLDASSIITKNIENIFFSDKFNLLILSNILIGCILAYKMVRIVISLYTSEDTEFPYLYILKSIILVVSMNCCLFFCEQILDINYLITQYLKELGEYLFGQPISFVTFSTTINSYITDTNNFNLFSLDGIIKSMITFGSISLLITYILRYILIKVLVLCSPFVFLCLLHDNLKIYFYNWFKYFLSLLLTQNIICIVLYIPYLLEFDDELYSKFLVIGTIMFLYQLNNYIKEFLGGFSTSGGSGINTSILRSMKGK